MLATFAEALDAVAKVPKETWSSIGTGVGLAILAVLGTIASRKGAADKAAQPASVPLPTDSPSGQAGGSVTFLADADTERAILAELRRLRANQEKLHDEQERRREASERRRLEVENHGLRSELELLRAGQRTTHGNQGVIAVRTETIEGKLDALMRRLDID